MSQFVENVVWDIYIYPRLSKVPEFQSDLPKELQMKLFNIFNLFSTGGNKLSRTSSLKTDQSCNLPNKEEVDSPKISPESAAFIFKKLKLRRPEEDLHWELTVDEFFKKLWRAYNTQYKDETAKRDVFLARANEFHQVCCSS